MSSISASDTTGMTSSICSSTTSEKKTFRPTEEAVSQEAASILRVADPVISAPARHSFSVHIPMKMRPFERLTLENIERFAGEFIVFQVADDIYFPNETPFRMKDPNIRYGRIEYINSDGLYQMVQLRIEDSKAPRSGTYCLLSKELLRDHPMVVRLATYKEVYKMHTATHTNQATLEYDFFGGRVAPAGFFRDSCETVRTSFSDKRGDCTIL